MTIGITDLIAGVFKPAADLIDNLHTSTEEKLEQKANLLNVQATILQMAVSYELQSLQARANIVSAEAKSESWLAASWRPITMLTFLTLIVLNALGWIVTDINDRMWFLMELGLGGYVGGRSIEKVVKTVTQARSMKKASE